MERLYKKDVIEVLNATEEGLKDNDYAVLAIEEAKIKIRHMKEKSEIANREYIHSTIECSSCGHICHEDEMYGGIEMKHRYCGQYVPKYCPECGIKWEVY